MGHGGLHLYEGAQVTPSNAKAQASAASESPIFEKSVARLARQLERTDVRDSAGIALIARLLAVLAGIDGG